MWRRLADQVAFLRSFGSRKERNERFLLAGADRRISVIFFDFFKKFQRRLQDEKYISDI